MRQLKQLWGTARASIAFYPAIIAVAFLLLSGAMLELDFSDAGKNIKASYKWLRLRDASTARAIISTIATGLLSFTVFSFSMVMILLTQAAGQLSNRILSALIGQRFQQLVLGCYIGSIVYALFLLTAIRDIDSGIYIPALSIYLLIFFTLGDVFLFIYFLHFVTQSVRYETVIGRILSKTDVALRRASAPAGASAQKHEPDNRVTMLASQACGYYQGFDAVRLVDIACRSRVVLRLLHPVGTYLLEGSPVLEVLGADKLSQEEEERIHRALDFHTGADPDSHYLYGFRQLTEVALRALSPGINDPSTAVQALEAFARLLALRMSCPPATHFADADGALRIIAEEPSLGRLVKDFLWPVWDYGKADRFVQTAMHGLLAQLSSIANNEENVAAFQPLLATVKRTKQGAEAVL